jgi:hypothetical protein
MTRCHSAVGSSKLHHGFAPLHAGVVAEDVHRHATRVQALEGSQHRGLVGDVEG